MGMRKGLHTEYRDSQAFSLPSQSSDNLLSMSHAGKRKMQIEKPEQPKSRSWYWEFTSGTAQSGECNSKACSHQPSYTCHSLHRAPHPGNRVGPSPGKVSVKSWGTETFCKLLKIEGKKLPIKNGFWQMVHRKREQVLQFSEEKSFQAHTVPRLCKLPIECGDCEQMTVTSLHLSLLTHRFNGFDDDNMHFSGLYRLNELVSIHLEN